MSLGNSHPNGIVPSGNLLFSPDLAKRSASIRFNGLGPRFQRMSDEQFVDFLTYLDMKSLLQLGQCSKLLHVFTSLEPLWRDLALQDMENENIVFDHTWRRSLQRKRLATNTSPNLSFRIDGYASDFLFKQWLCSGIRFERDVPHFLKFNDIPRIPLEEMSVERYVQEFELPNKPVVITKAVTHWPAIRKWADQEYLEKVCHECNRSFRATSAAAGRAASFTMSGYLQYAHQVREEAPLYLFDRDFALLVPALTHDYDIPKYFTTNTVLPSTGHVHCPDLFSLLGEVRRPDYRWLVVGPATSGSLFHIDPNMTNAWNASIVGRKKWIFYPPTRVPPGVHRSEDGADVTVPVSTSEWLHTFWSNHLEARHHPDPSQRPLEVVTEPGDLIFVPHGWWHMVVNLDFNIALTHNFVSTSNLADVLRFFSKKMDQISGVKEHSEEMHDEFVHLLRGISTDGQATVSDSRLLPVAQLERALAESRREFDINRDSSISSGLASSRAMPHLSKGRRKHMSSRRHYTDTTSSSTSDAVSKSGQRKRRGSPDTTTVACDDSELLNCAGKKRRGEDAAIVDVLGDAINDESASSFSFGFSFGDQ